MNVRKLVVFKIICFSLFSFCFSMQRSVESNYYDQSRGQVVLTYSVLLKMEPSFDCAYVDPYLDTGRKLEPHYRMLYSLDNLLGHPGKPVRSLQQNDSDYQDMVREWKEHFLLEILLSLLEVNIVITHLCNYFPPGADFVSEIEMAKCLKTFYSGKTRQNFFDELCKGRLKDKFDISLIDGVSSLLHLNKHILEFWIERLNGVKEPMREGELFKKLKRFFIQREHRSVSEFFWGWLTPLYLWIVENIRILPFARLYDHVTFQDGVKLKDESLDRIKESKWKLIQELKKQGARLGIDSCAIPIESSGLEVYELREHLRVLMLL